MTGSITSAWPVIAHDEGTREESAALTAWMKAHGMAVPR
jgi:hypothetical protein